jgi:flagellar biosynthesis protein FliR
MVATALAIALPVALLLLLVQVMTGVISRSAPSLNLFALGLPAGVLAGIAALILAAPMVTDRLTDLSATAVAQAAQIVASANG